MANTDKDIIITPSRGASTDPAITFKGANASVAAQTIYANVYPTSNCTISFEGSAGQLFSITNTLSGTLFSVNDVSGIPSIEVLDTGLIKLAQYSGNVGIGTSTVSSGNRLFVQNGNITVAGFSGNTTVISPQYITLTTAGNVPAAPPSGRLQLFAKQIATRSMTAQQGPSGIDTTLQPLIGKNRVYYWAPPGLNTTTAPAAFLSATAFTTVGTATARAFATTDILTRTSRVAYVSATTAAAFASLRVASAWLTTGTGTGLGGFTYICRFGVSDGAAVAGARMFVGLSSNTGAATNVEPSTLTNSFGVAQLSTDNTQWYFVYGGSAAQTAIALGTSLGAPTATNTLWDLSLFSPPGSNGVIGYTMSNLGTGVSVTGSITPGTPGTQTPANTTALTPQIWRTNNATLLAVAIDFASLYIETDD